MKFAKLAGRVGTRKSKRCLLFRPLLEMLEARWVRAALPFGADVRDTAEFMLGRVAVTPVLLESNGQIDASTENWNRAHIDEVLAKLGEGLDWWEQLLATKSSVHSLDFVIDRTYADQPVPTAYEPINRVSNDYSLWTQEFLTRTGYTQSSSLEESLRAFNNAQRQKVNADWSFTIFVVNSEIENEGTFASGGSFNRAFAFAGGLFFVTPSMRPASTFAHETGHIFWARDEYAGGSSYFERRGYYDTQNKNALDNNPTQNFQQSPSIMSSGIALQTAFDQVMSPASTLAMIGWQDSDADGIFDVLDVPLQLDGVGRVDVQTGSYRFTGYAKAQTLPNRNSAGLGNDITLNKVSRIEVSFSGGPWATVAQPEAHYAELDISIPLGGRRSGALQLRAIDGATGVTSNSFDGTIGAAPDATAAPGINGFVWNDANSNGLVDAVESGLGLQQVRLVDANGQTLNLQRAIEPDEKLPGMISATAYASVRLSAVGDDTNGNLGVFADASASTGARVFRPYSVNQASFVDSWNDRRQLKIEFPSPTSFVSVDVIGSGARSYGRLELYSASGALLERVTTRQLANGRIETLQLGRSSPDIAYALVRGHMNSSVKLDNLDYGPTALAITDSFGRYSFQNLPAGPYQVQIVLSGVTSQVTSPGGQQQLVNVQPPLAPQRVDFGINYQNTPWHNLNWAADVNDDGFVTAMDALLVINLLNQNGTSSALTASALPFQPYVDVSNDGFLSAIDALLVINFLNRAVSEGEGYEPTRGEDRQDLTTETTSPYAEGELWPIFDPYSDPLGASRRMGAKLRDFTAY